MHATEFYIQSSICPVPSQGALLVLGLRRSAPTRRAPFGTCASCFSANQAQAGHVPGKIMQHLPAMRACCGRPPPRRLPTRMVAAVATAKGKGDEEEHAQRQNRCVRVQGDGACCRHSLT